MRCFVIMPFDSEFDDVYTTIKRAVARVPFVEAIECSRLDEARPAGRITDRLLASLRAAAFCIADLTGNKPNVMWETGYAMALGKPIVITTQDVASLPFDVKDMQALSYDRGQLSKTLEAPLHQIVCDTLAGVSTSEADSSSDEDQARLVVSLGVQLAEVKMMVSQMVGSLKHGESAPVGTSSPRLKQLEGSWLNHQSDSHVHIRLINEVVVAPYCYGGNTELTAYYYDWKELGDYMFARFKWMAEPISGFTFLKPSGPGALEGAWWYDGDVDRLTSMPPATMGNPVTWSRTERMPPGWANRLFQQVMSHEVVDFL